MTEPEGTIPAALLDRLRAHGATDTELARVAGQHADLPYYQRFLANQQGSSYDDASVQALLEATRVRWIADDQARSAFTDGATGEGRIEAAASDATRSVPQPGTQPAAAEEQLTATQGPPTVAAHTAPPAETAVDDSLVSKVPDGTRDEVLDWVDKARSKTDRTARARAALAAELRRADADRRVTLVDELQRRVARGQDDQQLE